MEDSHRIYNPRFQLSSDLNQSASSVLTCKIIVFRLRRSKRSIKILIFLQFLLFPKHVKKIIVDDNNSVVEKNRPKIQSERQTGKSSKNITLLTDRCKKAVYEIRNLLDIQVIHYNRKV